MAMQLVASGGNSLEALKDAITRAPGRGTTVIELDVKDRVNIPFLPDPVVGAAIRRGLPALDFSLEAIPGVHLVSPTTYSVSGNTGTIRVSLRTNPLDVLPFAVGAALSGILGPVGAVALTVVLLRWRIFNDRTASTSPGGPVPVGPGQRVPTPTPTPVPEPKSDGSEGAQDATPLEEWWNGLSEGQKAIAVVVGAMVVGGVAALVFRS